MPARETVRLFLAGYVGDADGMEEVRDSLRRTAAVTTRSLHRNLAALEEMLSEPQPAGDLAHLVAWEANVGLDDPSDAGAAEFLGKLAQLLREVLAEAER